MSPLMSWVIFGGWVVGVVVVVAFFMGASDRRRGR